MENIDQVLTENTTTEQETLRTVTKPIISERYNAKITALLLIKPIILFVFLMAVGTPFLLGGVVFKFDLLLAILGAILAITAISVLLKGIFYLISTVLKVEDNIIIISKGLVSRSLYETPVANIQTIGIIQGVFARMMGYGTVSLTNSSNEEFQVAYINNPVAFKKFIIDLKLKLNNKGN